MTPHMDIVLIFLSKPPFALFTIPSEISGVKNEMSRQIILPAETFSALRTLQILGSSNVPSFFSLK